MNYTSVPNANKGVKKYKNFAGFINGSSLRRPWVIIFSFCCDTLNLCYDTILLNLDDDDFGDGIQFG